jgi:hypothetical protein
VFSLHGLIGSLIGIPGNLLAGALPQVFRSALGVTVLVSERLTLLSLMVFLLPAFMVLLRLRSGGPPQPTTASGGAPAVTPKREAAAAAAQGSRIRAVLVQVAVVAALMGLADGLFFPFGNVYFNRQYGFDTDRVGYVFATTQALVIVLFVLIPPMARRWKKAHILAGCRFAALPFTLLLALGLPAWLAWPSFALAHTAFRTTMVVGDNIIVDIVPAAQRARASGLRSVGLSLGAMVSNATGGALIDRYGYLWPILGSAILSAMLATAILSFFSPREALPGQSAIGLSEVA